ncbi:MAG: sulfatase [Candidatus Binatia bacterium]
MTKTSLIILAAGALALCGLFLALRPRVPGPYPGRNILVITVDTLRPDHLGAYGYHRPTSPAIDALARRGVTFDMAFAPRGMTWPSLATMLTSLSPTTTNVRWNGQYLPQGVPTMASLAREAGYETRAFLGGSICHMARAMGVFESVECGEDLYVGMTAVEFLRAKKEKPFFSWVHLMAPHAPYKPPAKHDVFSSAAYKGPVGRDRFTLDQISAKQKALSEADLAQLHGLYDGEVQFADQQVGLLLATLDEQGLLGDTIIAFTADHGEDLYEHHRYLYHACSIYDSSLRIPLILALPDDAKAGTRYSRVVELIDLAPTLLELAGIGRLPSFEGKSMLRRLAGSDDDDGEPGEAVAVSEWYDPDLKKSLQTVRTERWRYISNPEGLTPQCLPAGDYYKVAREELYDHSVDPAESRNVAAEHPQLTKWLSELTGRSSALDDAPLPVDPKLTEELRSFGYIQ